MTLRGVTEEVCSLIWTAPASANGRTPKRGRARGGRWKHFRICRALTQADGGCSLRRIYLSQSLQSACYSRQPIQEYCHGAETFWVVSAKADVRAICLE